MVNQLNNTMKKRLFCSILAALSLFGQDMAARDLVVTLKDGSRFSYPLSTSAAEGVVMKRGEGVITLNGDVYPWADIKELRIYKQRPDDAVPVGIRAVEGQTPDASREKTVYDLGGRRTAEGSLLHRGVYVVNHKKIAVR